MQLSILGGMPLIPQAKHRSDKIALGSNDRDTKFHYFCQDFIGRSILELTSFTLFVMYHLNLVEYLQLVFDQTCIHWFVFFARIAKN